MAPSKSTILVWDAPVRVFHWLLVLSFVGAYITAESERWRLIHVSLGYTMGGLVAFRILWGLVGTRHARFANFVRGPAAVLRYLRALPTEQREHHVGHNPAGAASIVLLLLLSAIAVGTGWAVYEAWGPRWLSGLHEGASNFMLAVVGVHIGGVVASSWLHRENLVRSMLTGTKDAAADAGIKRAWRTLAAVILITVLGFWWLQWNSAPAAPATLTTIAKNNKAKSASFQADER